jgi:dolichyl-phosphate-mannose-protein mannosyltransferase
MKQFREIAASTRVIFFAAVVTRLAAAVYIFRNYFRPDILFAQNEPSHIATALVSGLGFSSPYAGTPVAPTAQQPPLYPFIIAGIFKVCGAHTSGAAWTIVGLNILAGGVTAILICRLGRIYFSKDVGIVAAWLWALPWMYEALAFSAACSSAYLSALGFTALILLLLRVMERNRGWMVLGVFCGALVLLQTAFLAIFVAYWVCLIFAKAWPARAWMSVLGLALVLMPWTIRNYVEFGRLIPVRDNFGLELWLGNRPGMHGIVDYSGDFPDHDPSSYARMGEIDFMDAKSTEALRFITSHPEAFVARCLGRVVEFWCVPYRLEWTVVLALAGIGALLVCRAHRHAWLLLAPMVAYPLVFYLTHIFVNYRHPIDPAIILLAAYAIVELHAHRKRLGMGLRTQFQPGKTPLQQ